MQNQAIKKTFHLTLDYRFLFLKTSYLIINFLKVWLSPWLGSMVGHKPEFEYFGNRPVKLLAPIMDKARAVILQ